MKVELFQLKKDCYLEKYFKSELVVEVLCPGTKARDRGIKFDDYQAHGIAEYWIVDAKKQEVEKYILETGEYELVSTFNKKQNLESTSVAGFSIPVKAIFDETIFLQTLSEFLK